MRLDTHGAMNVQTKQGGKIITCIKHILFLVDQLVSLTQNSKALIRPVKKGKGSSGASALEQCPKEICLMKRAHPATLWIMCENCNHWYHIRCVGVTKKQAQNSEYKFKCDRC